MFFRNSTAKRSRTATSAESEAFATLVRSIDDAMISKDLYGTVTAWNSGAEHLYGYRSEQMLGKSIEITYPEAQLGDERSRHAKVIAGGFESGYRCTRIRADGSLVDVVMTLSPIRNSSGAVEGVASLSRPVNHEERERARLASIMEVAPDGILCVARDGDIVMLNTRLCELFDYEREELLGAKLETLLPEGIRTSHVHLRDSYLDSPRVRTMGSGLALLAQRRDGTKFPVEISLAPYRSGDDVLAIAIIRDVSEQRLLEASLRESETQLRQIAESANIVFVLLQLDPLKKLYVSPSCIDLFEIAPEEYVSTELGLGLVHPDDIDDVRDFQEKILAGESAHSEHRIVMPDARVKWIRTFAYPIGNAQGRTERIAITAEDITRQEETASRIRSAELAARNANLAKNEFLSRMSHELRTPLNAILGFGQLLHRELDASEYSDSVGHILKAGRHLLDLINDVLEIAKIEANEMSLSMEPVPLGTTIQEVLLMMEPIALGARVELLTHSSHSSVWVHADRLRLRQILLNLISNGIKYNHPKGHVWVDYTETDTEAVITVRDDGPGIAVELQSRLFTPFDRLGAEIGGIEGTGIGLSLSRALVELMSGRISVQSTSGLGSSFIISLPIDATVTAAVPHAPAPEPSGKTLDGPITSATLLYIEDNLLNVHLVESLLRLRPGWRLLHASLGQLGMDMAKAHQPDFVILDLHLPDLAGRDVLTMLKNDPATSTIPVLVLTADASVNQRSLLDSHGADFFMTKPLDLDEFLAVLDTHIMKVSQGA